MPTYSYRCRDCGAELDVVQKFSDDPLTVCPTCQGALRKVFSPVGVVFKGSGFYRTDSRAKNGAERTGGQNGEKGKQNGDSGSGTGGTTESGGGSGTKQGASSGASDSSASKTPAGAKPAGPAKSGTSGPS